MFYNSVEVKTIMIAVQNVESIGGSSRLILLNSITWLREQYEHTKDIIYLKKAVWHIYAYLELGYPYESGRIEFDKIVWYLNLNVESLFPKKDWEYKRISLTKANVNRLLGKWNAHFQSMRIDDAVFDIIHKVKNKEMGKYVYHCGRVIEEYEDQVLWEKTFMLHITEAEAILQDINKGKYYLFNEG